MKDLFVALVGVVMTIFTARYAYQIWRREISPTLSTWITFMSGIGLSLATYMFAAKWDIRSGILNTMDFIAVAVILFAVLKWGKNEVRFKPFEKWYLVGITFIIIFGIFTGDAWNSNILTQVLISVGYLPTAHNLLKEKRNVESFSGWGCALIAALLALYPAIKEGNGLAVAYTIRTIFFVGVIISLMMYYKNRQ